MGHRTVLLNDSALFSLIFNQPARRRKKTTWIRRTTRPSWCLKYSTGTETAKSRWRRFSRRLGKWSGRILVTISSLRYFFSDIFSLSKASDCKTSCLWKRQRWVSVLDQRNALGRNGRFPQNYGSQNCRIQNERQILNDEQNSSFIFSFQISQ